MKKSSAFGLSSSIAAFVLLASSGPARADAAGDAFLAKVDSAVNRAKTLTLDYEIVHTEPGKAERALRATVLHKGDKRVFEFNAPADMKGTKMLILSPTEMYSYLPSFGKVRRVASHTSDQGFMGLVFNEGDIATTAYGSEYSATVASEDAKTSRLVLTPKTGKTTPYAKIEITVQKDKNLPSEIKYFGADGKNAKTETRTNYACKGDVCVAGEVKMTDNTKGTWTKFVVKVRNMNTAIEDDVFSKRSLEK